MKPDIVILVLGVLRYLDGGCVLFYPQLARVSSYQLFVEVRTWKLNLELTYN